MLLAALVPAHAADQTIRGRSLSVAQPSPAHRKVVVRAWERRSAHTLTGDPTAPPNSAGAVVQLFVEGGTPSAQTFVLGQGTASSGRPFWRPRGAAGFEYADRRGERGPVQSLRLRRRHDGTILLAATLAGAALDIVPPDPGVRAFLTLTLGAGDRYCVQFGPGGIVRDDALRFAVARVTTEGCPATVTGEFLALSYNVAGLPQGISGSDPEINTPLIAPLLDGYDVVVLQETWKTPDPNPFAPLRVYHEILEAGASHPFKSSSMPQPLNMDPRRPGAILADGLNTFARFPFGEITREMWTGCDNSAADCLALKGFSMVRLTVAPGVTIDLYDLHMEAGGTANDDALRDAGVTQLSTFVQAHSAGHAIVVGGDFNLHTDEEPDATQFQRLLAATGLQDVCATLGCPSPGRIDKFLFRSSARITLEPLSWRFETDVFLRDGGIPLSDHDPLAVRFRWTHD